MRTIRFIIYFLIFSILISLVDDRASIEKIISNSYERDEVFYPPSKCGAIFLNYYINNGWKGYFDTIDYKLDCRYHMANYDPQDTITSRSHFVEGILPNKGILYSTFVFDESNISNSKKVAQYFFESSGKTWSNILINQEKSLNCRN
jgi:hypothetical protein